MAAASPKPTGSSARTDVLHARPPAAPIPKLAKDGCRPACDLSELGRSSETWEQFGRVHLRSSSLDAEAIATVRAGEDQVFFNDCHVCHPRLECSGSRVAHTSLGRTDVATKRADKRVAGELLHHVRCPSGNPANHKDRCERWGVESRQVVRRPCWKIQIGADPLLFKHRALQVGDRAQSIFPITGRSDCLERVPIGSETPLICSCGVFARRRSPQLGRYWHVARLRYTDADSAQRNSPEALTGIPQLAPRWRVGCDSTLGGVRTGVKHLRRRATARRYGAGGLGGQGMVGDRDGGFREGTRAGPGRSLWPGQRWPPGTPGRSRSGQKGGPLVPGPGPPDGAGTGPSHHQQGKKTGQHWAFQRAERNRSERVRWARMR